MACAELADIEDIAVQLDCLVAVEKDEFVFARLVAFDSALFRLALSGNPSHLLFTFGTWSGSFCVDTPGIAEFVPLPPFCRAFSFSAAANSAKADVEGSFNAKKPSTPPFFRFFVV